VTKSYIFNLKNSLQVIFLPIKDAKVVYINYRVKAGSSYENEKQIGAAHLVEHLLMYRDKQLLTQHGGKIYGITSRDESLFYIKILKEHFEQAIQCLGDTLNIKTIEIEDVITQKNIIKQEIKKTLNNPEREVFRRSYATLYPTTRLAILNTGTIEDIDKLELEETEHFLNKHYTTNNSILVIAGDIESRDVENIVTKYLENLDKGDKIEETIVPEDYSKDIKVNILDKEYPQKYLKIDYYGYKLKDTNKYAVKYLEFILDNYLNEELRYKNSLVYKIHLTSFSASTYGTFSIYTVANNKDVYKEILKYITYTKLEKVLHATDLETVRNNVVSDFIFEIEKPANLVSFYSENYLFNNHITPEEEIQNYKDVTEKDILEVIKHITDQSPSITIS